MKSIILKVDLDSEIKEILEEIYNEQDIKKCNDWHIIVDWSQIDENEYDITVEYCGDDCELKNKELKL